MKSFYKFICLFGVLFLFESANALMPCPPEGCGIDAEAARQSIHGAMNQWLSQNGLPVSSYITHVQGNIYNFNGQTAILIGDTLKIPNRDGSVMTMIEGMTTYATNGAIIQVSATGLVTVTVANPDGSVTTVTAIYDSNGNPQIVGQSTSGGDNSNEDSSSNKKLFEDSDYEDE